ncbi:MAG: Bug family tripartite tricarboxylate transporter substrate binding protein [Comamonas sp.]
MTAPMISRRSAIAAALAAGLAPALHAQGTAGGWPSKPIRLIVPFPPGGGTDFLSRTIATRLGEATGWTLVPDNRAGAGGTIGIAEAAKAEASGHTLVMGQLDNLVIAPLFYQSLPYDPLRDLQAVALVADSPLVYVVPAASPHRSLGELIAAARQAPDTLAYASPGTGTITHLSVELFAHEAKIRLRHVPYKGSGPALADTLGGQVQMLAASIPSVMGQLKAGKLRALAVTSARRNPALPDVPSVAEQGLAGFDVSTWYGVFAPKGVPAAVVERLHTAINQVLGSDEIRSAILSQGGEPQPISTQALEQRLRQDSRKWREAVASTGLKLELG